MPSPCCRLVSTWAAPFGQTVNIAARVQQLPMRKRFLFRRMSIQLKAYTRCLLPGKSSVFKLEGIQQDLRVFRITNDLAALSAEPDLADLHSRFCGTNAKCGEVPS